VKDLPRLAPRVSINTNSICHSAVCLRESKSETSDSLDLASNVWNLVSAPIRRLSKVLSPSDLPDGSSPSDESGGTVIDSTNASQPMHKRSAVAEIILVLSSILADDHAETVNVLELVDIYDSQVANGIDPQISARDLLEGLGGDSSVIVRALKLINQGVVLYALEKLQESFPSGSDIMTKDVRGPSGWLIHIDIFESFRIRHVRREQSLDLWGDSTNHFEYEFEISATLDKRITTVHATWLRINEVHLGQTMEPARKQVLQLALGTGGRIIS